MASIYGLKPAFQSLLRPLVRAIARWGVTANQVTVAAALLSAAGGGALALWPAHPGPLLAVPPILFVRMALNAIDGMLAREHGMQTSLGAVLNEIGDVVADALLYLPFALHPRVDATAVVVVVLLAAISEMTGVVAVQIGASRRYDGPMGKSDRAVLFGALGLLLAVSDIGDPWTSGLLYASAGLLALTIVNRARRALRETVR